MGRDLENSIGIKLEGDLDLRNTTRGGGDTGEFELSEKVVVLGQRSLTLVDLDKDDGLVVGGGGEDLALTGRDRGVAGDELSHDTASGLDTKGQGVDIHEDNLVSALLAGKDTSLNSSTESDGLIGVDTLGSLLSAEVLLNQGNNLGNTCGATNQYDIVNLVLLDVGVLENLLNGLEGLLEEVNVELLELGAGKGLGEVIAVVESLDLNASGHLARKSSLGLLSFTLELAHSLEVLGDVDAILLVVALGEVVDDALIEILTTKMSVTSSSQNLKDTLLDREERDIESTTTEIVDNDLSLAVGLVQSVGNGCGGRLVDDSENVEAGNDTGILGGLSLVVLLSVSI